MAEFLDTPWAGLIVLAALTAGLVAVGVYAIGKVRAGMQETEPTASEWLTNFNELHAEGQLSEEEFRTIKAMLAQRLQQQLETQTPIKSEPPE